MREWIPRVDDYLAELIRLEGRGDADESVCPSCSGMKTPMYRCISGCFAGDLVCEDCCKKTHSTRPLDIIEVCDILI